jgi:predicted CoA-substrate-specific enzyme activase
MVNIGIDLGSSTTKAVVLTNNECFYSVIPTGINIPEAANQVIRETLEKANKPFTSINKIVATGYGRISVPFESNMITEITCCAVGVHHLFPKAKLIVDIGGQDSKVIKMNEKGAVLQFAMNDKCAAGTGKFLEVAAQTLGVNVSDLGEISSQSINDITISSTCTVFAQTEIISLIARNTNKNDIAAALHKSVVSRVFGLINSVNPEKDSEIVMTGGVAKNKAIVNLLGTMMGRQILIPDNPQIVTALGAALLA